MGCSGSKNPKQRKSYSLNFMSAFEEGGERQRWSDHETQLLKTVRERLHVKLHARPQYPEVVGDRKLIRFLRGHDHDIDRACEMIEKFLDWRIANNVDAVRHSIVEQGCNNVMKFPFAEKVLSVCKFLVFDPNAVSTDGEPIMAEGMLPVELWDVVTVDEYLRFRLYGLELISILLEQMSHEHEKKVLAGEIPSDKSKPYGYLQKIQVIRDVNGIGLNALQGTNKEAFSKATAMMGDNYPEILMKVHVINAPWIFGGIWNIAQVFLAPKTVAKVKVIGNDYLEKISNDITVSSVPRFLGGEFDVDHSYEFTFDTAEALKELTSENSNDTSLAAVDVEMK